MHRFVISHCPFDGCPMPAIGIRLSPTTWISYYFFVFLFISVDSNCTKLTHWAMEQTQCTTHTFNYIPLFRYTRSNKKKMFSCHCCWCSCWKSKSIEPIDQWWRWAKCRKPRYCFDIKCHFVAKCWIPFVFSLSLLSWSSTFVDNIDISTDAKFQFWHRWVGSVDKESCQPIEEWQEWTHFRNVWYLHRWYDMRCHM